MRIKKKKPSKKKVSREESKAEMLQRLVAQCNDSLGQSGRVYLGTERRPHVRLSTGIVALDYVLGGGLVRGQLVVFTGADSTAKTTAALIAIAAHQERDPDAQCVWLAAEPFDKVWAETWGVDLERLILIDTDTGDTALETSITLLESGAVDIMVYDSIQALGTEREMQGGVDSEAYAGAGAPQLWGRVMRRAYAAMNKGAQTAMVAISQVRSKIGGFSGYGPPEPEGSAIWAIKHWKAIDIYFKKGEAELEGEKGEKRRVKSRDFRVECKKNKTASTMGLVSTFTIARDDDGGSYIDNTGALFRLAVALDLVEQRGSFYEGYGVRVRGKDAYLEKVREDSDLYESISADLMKSVNPDAEG